MRQNNANVTKPSEQEPNRKTVRLLYLVKRVQHELYVRMESLLRPFGLTSVQYTVLSMLEQRDGLSSAQISRRFSVTPQTMIKQITALEDKELIVRHTTSANRRALQIYLTASGRQVLDSCDAAINALESTLTAELGDEEAARLKSALTQMLGLLSR